jgi:Tol biopolymer transport system component
LTANDTNGSFDVFVRDLQLGTTTLVSINRFGTGSGNDVFGRPEISADGRFVAFSSDATDFDDE